MDDKDTTVDASFKFSNYAIFKDAQANVKELVNSLTDQKETIKSSTNIICDEDVFYGPVATSCKDALDELNRKVDFATTNFSNIDGYFDEIYAGYEKADKDVSNKVLLLDDKGTIVTQTLDTGDEYIRKVIELGKQIAADSRYGYSTGGYGPNTGYNFDCGGLVWYLLNKVYGLNYDTTKGISPYMLSNQLPSYGFQKQKVNGPVDVSQLKVGDLLINPDVDRGHVAMYIGNGQILEARWNYDSKPGDSSGNEISINSYNARIRNSGNYNFNYKEIVHLQGRQIPTKSA